MNELLQNEQFVNLVVAIVSTLFTVVVLPSLSRWLNAQVGQKNTDLLIRFVGELVAAAQQQYKPGDEGMPANALKKDYVLQLAAAYAQRLGLKLDAEQVNALIEAAVYRLKQDQAFIGSGTLVELSTTAAATE